MRRGANLNPETPFKSLSEEDQEAFLARQDIRAARTVAKATADGVKARGDLQARLQAVVDRDAADRNRWRPALQALHQMHVEGFVNQAHNVRGGLGQAIRWAKRHITLAAPPIGIPDSPEGKLLVIEGRYPTSSGDLHTASALADSNCIFSRRRGTSESVLERPTHILVPDITAAQELAPRHKDTQFAYAGTHCQSTSDIVIGNRYRLTPVDIEPRSTDVGHGGTGAGGELSGIFPVVDCHSVVGTAQLNKYLPQVAPGGLLIIQWPSSDEQMDWLRDVLRWRADRTVSNSQGETRFVYSGVIQPELKGPNDSGGTYMVLRKISFIMWNDGPTPQIPLSQHKILLKQWGNGVATGMRGFSHNVKYVILGVFKRIMSYTHINETLNRGLVCGPGVVIRTNGAAAYQMLTALGDNAVPWKLTTGLHFNLVRGVDDVYAFSDPRSARGLASFAHYTGCDPTLKAEWSEGQNGAQSAVRSALISRMVLSPARFVGTGANRLQRLHQQTFFNTNTGTLYRPVVSACSCDISAQQRLCDCALKIWACHTAQMALQHMNNPQRVALQGEVCAQDACHLAGQTQINPIMIRPGARNFTPMRTRSRTVIVLDRAEAPLSTKALVSQYTVPRGVPGALAHTPCIIRVFFNTGPLKLHETSSIPSHKINASPPVKFYCTEPQDGMDTKARSRLVSPGASTEKPRKYITSVPNCAAHTPVIIDAHNNDWTMEKVPTDRFEVATSYKGVLCHYSWGVGEVPRNLNWGENVANTLEGEVTCAGEIDPACYAQETQGVGPNQRRVDRTNESYLLPFNPLQATVDNPDIKPFWITEVMNINPPYMLKKARSTKLLMIDPRSEDLAEELRERTVRQRDTSGTVEIQDHVVITWLSQLSNSEADVIEASINGRHVPGAPDFVLKTIDKLSGFLLRTAAQFTKDLAHENGGRSTRTPPGEVSGMVALAIKRGLAVRRGLQTNRYIDNSAANLLVTSDWKTWTSNFLRSAGFISNVVIHDSVNLLKRKVGLVVSNEAKMTAYRYLASFTAENTADDTWFKKNMKLRFGSWLSGILGLDGPLLITPAPSATDGDVNAPLGSMVKPPSSWNWEETWNPIERARYGTKKHAGLTIQKTIVIPQQTGFYRLISNAIAGHCPGAMANGCGQDQLGQDTKWVKEPGDYSAPAGVTDTCDCEVKRAFTLYGLIAAAPKLTEEEHGIEEPQLFPMSMKQCTDTAVNAIIRRNYGVLDTINPGEPGYLVPFYGNLIMMCMIIDSHPFVSSNLAYEEGYDGAYPRWMRDRPVAVRAAIAQSIQKRMAITGLARIEKHMLFTIMVKLEVMGLAWKEKGRIIQYLEMAYMADTAPHIRALAAADKQCAAAGGGASTVPNTYQPSIETLRVAARLVTTTAILPAQADDEPSETWTRDGRARFLLHSNAEDRGVPPTRRPPAAVPAANLWFRGAGVPRAREVGFAGYTEAQLDAPGAQSYNPRYAQERQWLRWAERPQGGVRAGGGVPLPPPYDRLDKQLLCAIARNPIMRQLPVEPDPLGIRKHFHDPNNPLPSTTPRGIAQGEMAEWVRDDILLRASRQIMVQGSGLNFQQMGQVFSRYKDTHEWLFECDGKSFDATQKTHMMERTTHVAVEANFRPNIVAYTKAHSKFVAYYNQKSPSLTGKKHSCAVKGSNAASGKNETTHGNGKSTGEKVSDAFIRTGLDGVHSYTGDDNLSQSVQMPDLHALEKCLRGYGIMPEAAVFRGLQNASYLSAVFYPTVDGNWILGPKIGNLLGKLMASPKVIPDRQVNHYVNAITASFKCLEGIDIVDAYMQANRRELAEGDKVVSRSFLDSKWSIRTEAWNTPSDLSPRINEFVRKRYDLTPDEYESAIQLILANAGCVGVLVHPALSKILAHDVKGPKERRKFEWG